MCGGIVSIVGNARICIFWFITPQPAGIDLKRVCQEMQDIRSWKRLAADVLADMALAELNAVGGSCADQIHLLFPLLRHGNSKALCEYFFRHYRYLLEFKNKKFNLH